MGYYTRFTVYLPIDWTEEMKQDLVDIDTGYFDNVDQVDYLLDDMMEEMKWYDFETDMSKLSKKHPKELFKLHGRGEEGDEWVAYFKDGKSWTTYGKMIFEEFDESKLK